MHTVTFMESSEPKGSQLSDVKKAILVICIFSCVGLIGYALQAYLSAWEFLVVMVALLLVLELLNVWFGQARSRRKQ